MRTAFSFIILLSHLALLVPTLGSLCRAEDLEIAPSVGLGGVSEGGRASSLYEKIGLRLGGSLWKEALWKVDGAVSRYRMTYFGLPSSAVRGGVTTVQATLFPLEENRFDYSGVLFYPIWPIWERGLQVSMLGGYRGILLANDLSTFHFGGPLLGLTGGAVYPWGTLHLRGDLSPNLLKGVRNHQAGFLTLGGSESVSLFGDPTLAASYSLEGWRPWQEDRRIGIGYEGEVLSFQRTHRLYHRLFLAIAF